MKKLPNFNYEERLWRRGFGVVCGADEVGRGAFAGPVVAAAVAFAPLGKRGKEKGERIEGFGIDDSKKLRPRQREKCAKFIKEHALAWGIGEVAASVINRLGMTKATKMAFRSAIADLKANLHKRTGSSHVDFLLVDAFYIPYTRGIKRKNQRAIVKGDEKSISIAAASIIAKVHRDKLMQELGKKHRVYRWGRNKGYGTRLHQDSILVHGLTRLHRKVFVRDLVNKAIKQ